MDNNTPKTTGAVLADLVAASTRLASLGWFRPSCCADSDAKKAMSDMRKALAAAAAHVAASAPQPAKRPKPAPSKDGARFRAMAKAWANGDTVFQHAHKAACKGQPYTLDTARAAADAGKKASKKFARKMKGRTA